MTSTLIVSKTNSEGSVYPTTRMEVIGKYRPQRIIREIGALLPTFPRDLTPIIQGYCQLTDEESHDIEFLKREWSDSMELDDDAFATIALSQHLFKFALWGRNLSPNLTNTQKCKIANRIVEKELYSNLWDLYGSPLDLPVLPLKKFDAFFDPSWPSTIGESFWTPNLSFKYEIGSNFFNSKAFDVIVRPSHLGGDYCRFANTNLVQFNMRSWAIVPFSTYEENVIYCPLSHDGYQLSLPISRELTSLDRRWLLELNCCANGEKILTYRSSILAQKIVSYDSIVPKEMTTSSEPNPPRCKDASRDCCVIA